MLYHMKLHNDAITFRQISTQSSVDKLLKIMNAPSIPKKVKDTRHNIDPIEKCMWILERRFNCRRLGCLNTTRLTSASAVVSNLSMINLPILMSVVGKESIYNHVVVVFRREVIDFEAREKYLLTETNVQKICGNKNPFYKVSRGYIILPSRQMKISFGDKSDWGDKYVREKLSHLVSK